MCLFRPIQLFIRRTYIALRTMLQYYIILLVDIRKKLDRIKNNIEVNLILMKLVPKREKNMYVLK